MQDNQVLKKVITWLKEDKMEIMDIQLTQSKIEILVKKIENERLIKLHEELISSVS